MALISVDGNDLPEPTDYSVSIYDITEAARNANGLLIADKIATKRKIELKWKYLSAGDLVGLLGLFTSNFFVTVTFFSPTSLTALSGTFYVGDRTQGGFHYDSGTARITYWKDVQLNLIEK